jgi:hypothetical protein
MKRWRRLVVLALLAPWLIPIGTAHAAYANVGVVTNGLLMYFDTANPSGVSGSTLTDLSGNGYNGTLTSVTAAPTYQSSNGTYLNFAGSGTAAGGYVDIPDLYSASAWGGLTISFYGNFGSTQDAFERIMDFGRGAALDNIEIARDYNTNAMYVEVFNNGSTGGYCRSGSGAVNTNVTGNSIIPTNTWTHWAVTIGGGYCTIYKNNVQVNQMAYTMLPRAGVTLTNNYLGKSNWVDNYLEGGIADFALYNRVLNSSELTQNYNAQTDITAPTLTTNYLSMNENQTLYGNVSASEVSTWSAVSGNDYSKFSLTSAGSLSFNTAPNYEAATDSNSDNQYSMNIRLIDANGNYTDTWLQVTVVDLVEAASLSPPSLSATPYKGISLTITVTPAGDGTSIPGKITYLMAGKRIPGCYKKAYSGTGNATCAWEPTVQGYREISVTFTPTNTNFTAASAKKTFLVLRRTTLR